MLTSDNNWKGIHMARLDGRRILITGAASGMGREIADLFAAEGAALALLDRDEAGAAKVAERLGVRSFACDVADRERAVVGNARWNECHGNRIDTGSSRSSRR